jgi:hypothetical protein
MYSVSSLSFDPTVTINNNTITSTYPSLLYPMSTTINASALTPNTSFPVVATFPTVAAVSNSLVYPYVNPLLPSIISYPDVNSNKDLRREITEYFFEKLVNNWLKYHYLELYHMLVVSGGKVSLVKDLNQIASNTRSDPSENSLKYDFLLMNYCAKSDVYKLLDKFRKFNNINWWDIKHHSDKVRMFIEHKINKYTEKDKQTYY